MAEAPNQTPPVESTLSESPEPDIDSLLSKIPGLKDVFGESGEATPEAKEPSPEAATTEVVEEIQLDPALPIEEPEPEVEEPKQEPDEEPKFSENVQKRIDKLTAARRTAEEKATALETELNDLKAKFQAPPPVQPTPQNPLVNVNTTDELLRRRDLSRTAKSWAIQHLDGGEIELDNGEKKFLTGDEVKLLLSRAEDMLDTHLPQRANFLAQKQEWDNRAKSAYPNLSKPGHKDNQEYQAWLKAAPEIQRFPDIALIIGDAMLGRQLRLQREAAAQKSGKSSNGNLPLSAPAPAAAPRVPRNRALSGAELSAIATDPQGGALDQFVNQLISEAEQSRPAQRTKR
jgi:hypothetical protein